jgi:hypothetical protein
MDLAEVGWRTEVDWIDLAQNAGCCEHGNEPLGSIKYGEFFDKLRNC